MSKFIKVNGNLAQISVTSSVNVWGVNGAGEIWNYIGPDPTSKNPWQQIAGNFARDLSQGSISAGSLANVWGINSAGQVWKYTGTPPPAKPSSGSNPWQEMAQSLTGGEFSGAYQVAAASDGTVWLIVRSRAGEGLPPVPFGDPVFSISRLLSDGTFKPIKGNLWQISVGSAKSVWGLDPEGNIYSYTQDDNNPWNLILGNLTSISAAADGMVCGINSAGEVFKYVGPPAPANPPSGSYPWQPITGGHLTQISVGSANNAWGLDSKGNVYRVTASGLTLINGQTLDTISAAADGTVWGLKEFVPYLCEQGPTAETPDNFGSGANYILGDPHRKILRDVRVTIEITEDLVTEPKEKDKKNYSPKFAFQLNANSSANPSAPEDTWIVWQQYIFGIGDVIQGAVNNWTAPALNSGNQTINSPAYTLVTLPTSNSVPAGYKLTFILGNDEAGNVTSVNFIVDDGEMEYPPVEIVLTSIPEVTSAELAPIVALELNLVGPGNLQTTRFRSGAGTITYSSSTTLTAQNAIPLCAALGKNAPTTGESSNSVYGLLPSLPASTLVQSFGWSNP